MKKRLLFTGFMALVVSAMSIGQVIDSLLIENGDFQLPATLKHSGQGFNDSVPGWFIDLHLGNNPSGVEDMGDGDFAAFMNNKKGETFQIIEKIDTNRLEFTLEFDARISAGLNIAPTDSLLLISFFYTFTTDSTDRVILDSLVYQDTVNQKGGTMQHIVHTYTVPKSEEGKMLAIGFDNRRYSTGGAIDTRNLWSNVDNVKLKVVDNTPQTIAIASAKAQSVTVTPNPSNGLFQVQSQEPIKLVEVYNITGKKIVSQIETTVNLTDYESGLYFLQATTRSNKLMVTKVIVR